MKIILEQLCLLFMFLVVGFVLGKRKIVNSEHTKILSVLEVWLFLPCTVFNAFYNNFTVANLNQYYMLIIISVALLCLLVCFARVTSSVLTKEDYKRNVFRYSLTISNYGYMGYALAQSLYGTDGLLTMILFALPFSIYTYTFGYCMLTNQKISFKRVINPVVVTIVIGAFFGITDIPLPAVLGTFVNKSASCMAPVSMLLAGITISEFKLKSLVNDVSTYFVSAIRLFVIPLGVILLFKPFFGEEVVRSAVLLCAMPCGLNTIVFPKLIGEDCSLGAKLAFVSNILALISIPLVLNFI